MASIEAIVEDRFLSLVNSARSEIRNKFKRTHEVLRAREAALLDKFEDEYMGVSIAEYNQQLSISKDGLKDALKGNENKEFLDQNLDMIDARIDELENRALTAKHSCKNVVLEWDVELEKKLSVTGDIHLNSMKDIRDYKKLGEPVATFGKHRNTPESSPGVFYYPSGIANNPVNTFMYICDTCNNRVQVFNKSSEFCISIQRADEFSFWNLYQSESVLCHSVWFK